jgi:DNA-directed RNA polymerase specialized sigma54-like protein
MPLTQKKVAMRLEVLPSTLNHLISTKAIRLPWGLEVPLKSLMPSSKSLLLEHLHDLATQHSGMSDAELALELQRKFGAHLSRRSVAQYRQDLGIGGKRRR